MKEQGSQTGLMHLVYLDDPEDRDKDSHVEINKYHKQLCFELNDTYFLNE